MSQTLSGTIIGNGNIFSSPTTKLDTELSDTSTNAVQNKVITEELKKKLESIPVATADTVGGIKVGTGLDILEGVLSVASSAGGGGVIDGDVSNTSSWWIQLGGKISLIINGGRYDTKRTSENDGSTPTYTIAFAKPFTTSCLTLLCTPETPKNIRYAYRTGFHIYNFNNNEFTFIFGGEQQGRYINWIAIGI